jgi:hypothetical protein
MNMTHAQSAYRVVEEALAFAHAALEDTTPHRVAEAKLHAAEVLPYIGRMRPAAVASGDARRLVELIGHLRAVLDVLERKVEQRSRAAAN